MATVAAFLLVGAASSIALAQGEGGADIIFDLIGSVFSFDGEGGPFIGQIGVADIKGENTPKNNGVTLSCVGCLFNFQTGRFTDSTSTRWFFAGGGTLSAAGEVRSGEGFVAEGSLLEGQFIGTPTVCAPDACKPGSFIFDATSLSSINQDLLDFFGLPAGDYSADVLIAFTGSGTPPGAIAGTGGSGSITATPVPEPPAAGLLMAGFLSGLALPAVRRRVFRSA